MEERRDYITYPPANRCIYCGRDDCKLSDEHIIPFALNGNWILPRASCDDCAGKTKRFEQLCLSEPGGMLFAMRSRLKFRSRRKSTLRNRIRTKMANLDGSGEEDVVFESDNFPAPLLGLELPVAGIIRGIEPTNVLTPLDMPVAFLGPHDPLPAGKMVKGFSFHILPFFQLLAKIGYSFAVAQCGTTDGLLTMLPDLILGKTDKAPHLVGGGCFGDDDLQVSYNHGLRLCRHATQPAIFAYTQIHLLGYLGLPKYHVVVGQRLLSN